MTVVPPVRSGPRPLAACADELPNETSPATSRPAARVSASRPATRPARAPHPASVPPIPPVPRPDHPEPVLADQPWPDQPWRTRHSATMPWHSVLVGWAVHLMRAPLLLPALLISALLLRREQPATVPAWEASQTLWRRPVRGVELTVVIPFYNPGDTLRSTVRRLVDVMRAEEIGFEVIAVSDGSTDGSEQGLTAIGPEVRVIVSPVNIGKGAALHRGFAHAAGGYVGFVDADGDIDPAHLASYLRMAQRYGLPGVYADKRHIGSESHASGFRKIMSYGFIGFIGTLFGLGVRDTQTGCKLFRRDVLARVLPRLTEQRFAFDLEFFVAAQASGVLGMAAAPVTLSTGLSGSTVTLRSVLRTLSDAVRVFGRLHLTLHYADEPGVEPAQWGGGVQARGRERPAGTLRRPAWGEVA